VWNLLISPVVELVGGFFKGKIDIQKAAIERETKALTNEANWNTVQAKASSESWKDEWLTLLVSIPMVMAFVPSLVPYVEEGFKVLEGMPIFYQSLVGGVFAASFGLKKLSNVFNKKGN
tara:strand:- start:213 stop:569 length:357 start_codon:yes stop_codon:yes gene_type:complete